MSTTCDITVILPSLNVKQYIRECMDSVLAQPMKNFEVLCVDAGSNDGTLELLRDYEAKDSRVRVILSDRRSYGYQMNLGLDAAQGDYIAIVETDDFLGGDMFGELLALSENRTVDVVKANFLDYCDFENGVHKKAIPNKEKKGLPENISFTARNMPAILVGHPSVWSAIYRTAFLREKGIRFMEEPGAGWVDNPFYFETLCAADSIRWTNKCYYYYRKTNPNSSSNSMKDLTLPLRRMLDNMDIADKYGFCDEEVQTVIYERALQYVKGVTEDPGYAAARQQVQPWLDKLLSRLNRHTVLEQLSRENKALYFRVSSPLVGKKPEKTKVLFYNWIAFDNPGRIGGGVTIYCYNLIEELIRLRPDVEVYFLSSGWAYDMTTSACALRATKNRFGDRVRSFEIVNSPVPAAQDFLLNNPRIAFESPALKHCLDGFLEQFGPFETIHFNNIEGLSLDVFDLKQKYSSTRFLYSMHNYVPICVTGFYFRRQDVCNCSPDHTAAQCRDCVAVGYERRQTERLMERVRSMRRAQEAAVQDMKLHFLPEEQWLTETGLDRLNVQADEADLKEFTVRATTVINQMDRVLAVSERVRELAIENGIRPELVQTSYIGTKIAAYQCGRPVVQKGQRFRLVFLGANYFFPEKGYPFLMEALAQLPEADAAQVDLVLTTTNGNPSEMKQKLANFHSVTVYQGYKHADLKRILQGASLGVIPVLWEDNLPQIAIEMVALGVPVLCSSAGGASELCSDPRFRFTCGDREEFLTHLQHFIHKPEELDDFWKASMRLVTMEQHCREMEQHLGLPKPAQMITFTAEEYGCVLDETSFLYDTVAGEGPEEEFDELSYKIGRTITLLPRKVRGGVACLQEHGVRYTVNRLFVHLRLPFRI